MLIFNSIIWVQSCSVVLSQHQGYQHPTWALAGVLALLLPTELPANVPGETEEGPSVWDPFIHMGNPDEVLGSWLQPGSDLPPAAF